MAKAYKGKFTNLENPHKYVGNPDSIIYRSFWERCAFRWADQNPNVKEWASEEIVIPYEHPIRGNRAKYFPDMFLKMSDGTIRLIEIKPKKETKYPIEPSRKTKKYLNEVTTWIINQEKWKAAQQICDKHKMTFEIWTEDTLKDMGILRSPKTEQTTLTSESISSRRPKMIPMSKRRGYTRPKRKS